MKIRFKFEKTGRLKYIGHLDLLNVWNRAVKSAKLPVSYSKGFNPHMLMSFAAPLSLGLESTSEYVDIDFEDKTALTGIAEKINKHFPEGLKITETYELPEPYKRIASIVAAAEYDIIVPFEITIAQISEFTSLETIEIMKKTKRKTEITDISPDILKITKNERGICAALSCGSVKNLKPELLLEALFRFIDISPPMYDLRIIRTEIFSRCEQSGLTPLSVV